MGSGKSEVARRLRNRGIPVIDADALGHRLIAPAGAAEAEVVRQFGAQVLTDGIIDRRKLGQLVFREPQARCTLNAILHPKIDAAIRSECETLALDGTQITLVEAALWGENGTLPTWMEFLVLVECPEALRVARVMQARGLSRDEALRRIAAQVPPERKRAIAQYIVHNNADFAALDAASDELTEWLYARSKRT
jgi:dephospho-CoA kinase